MPNADDQDLANVEIDQTRPHPARTWDYFLGGKDHYPADRELGAQLVEMLPDILDAARADRAFLATAVRHLVEEADIAQFLDIGTGLPTANNTHEVAQQLRPQARVVYVDNDPLVLAHARALLVGTPEGATAYLDADVRDPDTILGQAADTLDFDRPIGLMLLGIMQFVMDDDEAATVVRRLLDALPSGSHLALAHPASGVSDVLERVVERWNAEGAAPQRLRTREQIRRFFDGLEILDPGVVPCAQWRQAAAQVGRFDDRGSWRLCGVGRKP